MTGLKKRPPKKPKKLKPARPVATPECRQCGEPKPEKMPYYWDKHLEVGTPGYFTCSRMCRQILDIADRKDYGE